MDKNQQYWNDRLQKRNDKSFRDSLNVANECEKAYKEAIDEIHQSIEHYLFKYYDGKIEELEHLPDAEKNMYHQLVKQKLDPIDMRNYRKQMDDLLSKFDGATNLVNKDRFMAEMRFLRARQQVNIWEAMESTIEVYLKGYGMQLEETLNEHLMQEFEESYLYAHYEQAMVSGYAVQVVRPNKEFLMELINTPFNGVRFSDTVWNNSVTLNNALQKQLRAICLQGKGAKQVMGNLKQFLNPSTLAKNGDKWGRYATRRIVVTEASRVFSDARRTAYQERGETHYTIACQHDSKACDKCKDNDGKKFPMTERVLPFHPNCRCTMLNANDDGTRYNKEEIVYMYNGKEYTDEQAVLKQLKADGNSNNKSLIKKRYKVEKAYSMQKWKDEFVTD